MVVIKESMCRQPLCEISVVRLAFMSGNNKWRGREGEITMPMKWRNVAEAAKALWKRGELAVRPVYAYDA